MAVYNLFQNKILNKNGKFVKRWYYWFYNESGRQIKKACKGCKTKAEADSYINQLPPLNNQNRQNKSHVLLRDIAADMYLPGSEHVERRRQMGKSVKLDLLSESRTYIKQIIEVFGDADLFTLDSADILRHLFTVKHSGSWKNRYIQILREVYRQAAWKKYRISMPIFEEFSRNSKKPDVLTTNDIKSLFIRENFSHDKYYYMFLLALSAGLRLGEVRAARPVQLLIEYQSIIVDGFISRKGERMKYNKTGSEEHPRFRVALLPVVAMEEILYYAQSQNIGIDSYIFSENGKPIDQSVAGRQFKKAVIHSGIPVKGRKITPHSLRYTYVTRTRRLLDAHTVQIMAGHSSAVMSEAYNRPELLENAKVLAPRSNEINRFFE